MDVNTTEHRETVTVIKFIALKKKKNQKTTPELGFHTNCALHDKKYCWRGEAEYKSSATLSDIPP